MSHDTRPLAPARRRRTRLGALAAIGVLTIGAAACGSDDDDVDIDDTISPANTIDTGPLPTTAGSGPLESYETDTSSDASDGTVTGDPMEPSTNDTTVTPDLTGP